MNTEREDALLALLAGWVRLVEAIENGVGWNLHGPRGLLQEWITATRAAIGDRGASAVREINEIRTENARLRALVAEYEAFSDAPEVDDG